MHKKGPNTKNNDFSTKSLAEVNHVSCATVLIRIIPAPKSRDGLLCLSRTDFEPDEWERLGLAVPAPDYSSSVYDSSRCIPKGIETHLYECRKGAMNPPVGEYVRQRLLEEQPDKDISR